MNPRIENLTEKKLIGQSTTMSLLDNKTGLLWGKFAPRVKEINNRVSEDKISMHNLSEGMYYLMIQQGEKTAWIKLYKK